MKNKQQLHTDNDSLKQYNTLSACKNADEIMLREQPYYRYGMSKEEAEREEKYMNLCLDCNPMLFFEGKYIPLWKQNLFR